MNETNLHDSLAVAFNITHVRAMSVGFFVLFVFCFFTLHSNNAGCMFQIS